MPPDRLMPTYESWIVHCESWLPPFPFARQYDRDRDATGRFGEQSHERRDCAVTIDAPTPS
jgi:hypothetical protein